MLALPATSKASAFVLLLCLSLPAHAQGFFEQSAPFPHLPTSANTPVMPWTDPSGVNLFSYAPTDVAESHPAQVLTVFKPSNVLPGKRYPTVVFCTAGHFAQIPPQTGPMGFLAKARENGFVVITVGTVGANSWPTCAQFQKCSNDPPGSNVGPDPGCASTLPDCWDPNIFYSPDEPSSPWDDFNYFYGEKDLTWAVQYVRLRAQDFQVDEARIILSGASTGAIYAGFVAFGPNRAWTDTSLSLQSRLDTRVAGVACFEPVLWHHALPVTKTPPGIGVFGGPHWPTADMPSAGNPYRTRSPILTDTPDSSLVLSSSSRLLRQYEPRVPVFLASGDGASFSTGFGRNGNSILFDQDEDYDVYGSSAPVPFIPGDPKIDFPHGTNVPEMRLHDTWNIIRAGDDLEIDQTGFHARYSRTFVDANTNWNRWPASKTSNGVVPNPTANPDFLDDIPLLDGTFPAAGPSSLNPDLAPIVVQWMKRTFCVEGYPAVYCRNQGMNYPVVTGSTLIVGGSATVTVNMREVPEVYDAAWLYGFGLPAEIPVVDGEYILCADDGQGELLGLAMGFKDANGLVEFTIDVPNDPALEGAAFFTQARLYDLDGTWPDALTNAQDMVIQGL